MITSLLLCIIHRSSIFSTC